MWEKNTLFEETTRVPLLIADPRFSEHHGKHFTSPVEILNLAPTLYDMLGINPLKKCPKSKFCHLLDGVSMKNVITLGVDSKIGRDFALSQTRVCRKLSSKHLPLEKERGFPRAKQWDVACEKNNKKFV